MLWYVMGRWEQRSPLTVAPSCLLLGASTRCNPRGALETASMDRHDTHRKRELQLVMEWTYYEDGVCDDTYGSSFYEGCYRDKASYKDMRQEIEDSLMNPLTLIDVNEGTARAPTRGRVWGVSKKRSLRAGVYIHTPR